MPETYATYDQLHRRLEDLRVEFESGQRLMAELDAKRANTKDTLLRISGAIQVLEELLSPAPIESDNGRLPDVAVPVGQAEQG